MKTRAHFRLIQIPCCGQMLAYRGSFVRRFNCNCGLDRLDALSSRSNGLTERSTEPLIGFNKLRVLIRRGNRRL